ncbi:unnamed protein product [Strongylus vulgaris]|uniref:Uncharacterized protein n=1 Tax=Strongylus vulgaris TaxID=40348 RepID=A0A3P7IS00_STRVU|nr:unnamed protein product [Strongylus vulgaris]
MLAQTRGITWRMHFAKSFAQCKKRSPNTKMMSTTPAG